MDPTPPTRPGSARSYPRISPWSILILAACFGLAAGYLDLAVILLRRDVLHATLYYEQAKHFRWVVPVVNLAIMLGPGLVLAAANRARPGLLSLGVVAWTFATLAIWWPLLRTPLYGAASFVLALGIARVIGRWASRHTAGCGRIARYGLVMLAVVTFAIAGVDLGRHAMSESRALAKLPPAPGQAPNVLLVVMDTVRADHLGLYGYTRNTSPQLARWAARGVRFEWALAPAPWTFPSHCSFMTGQWPSTLGAHWQRTVDPAYATLAEFLSSHGYHTAGFAANTYWCSYESNMDRGFVHYEDYPLSVRNLLACTMPGRWIAEQLSNAGDYYSRKWIRTQSRDAALINRAFLHWLARDRQRDRPFFAFLNYLDAHEPFLAPAGAPAQFGLRAESSRDQAMLLQYWDLDKLTLSNRDVELARDSYDNCIAALDRQVGALLEELDRLGTLRHTLVVITSDHGEQFGEHGVFNHGFSAYAAELRVPLLVISGTAPAGVTVSEPVSLRDLPATIADMAGTGAKQAFPGESWARYWNPTGGSGSKVGSLTLSEVDIPMVIGPERGRGPRQRGFTMSLVADGLHYLIDMNGTEELYDLANDPDELRDLKANPDRSAALARFRYRLAEIIRDTQPTNTVVADYHKRFRTLLQSLIPPPKI